MYLTVNESFTDNILLNEADNESFGDVIKRIQDAQEQAEFKPKGWIAQKIAQFRQLYRKFLKKLNEEKQQEKIGVLKNVIRVILNAIDKLARKIQLKFDKRDGKEWLEDLHKANTNFEQDQKDVNQFIFKNMDKVKDYASKVGEQADRKSGKIF
jgi:molecular chaperone GrpE (heat shock protein)